MNSKLLLQIIVSLLLIMSCSKDEAFKFNVSYLVETDWGRPNLVGSSEQNNSYTHDIPLNFRENGTVAFGNSYEDFWNIYDAESILIEEKKELWVIHQLTPDTLYVTKLRHPTTELLVRHIYTPFQVE